MRVFFLTPSTNTFYKDFFIPFANTFLTNILIFKGFLGIFFPNACLEAGLLHLNLWRKCCLKTSEAAFGTVLWSCLLCLRREKGSFVPCASGPGAPAQAVPSGEDGISLQGFTGWFGVWGSLGNPAQGQCEVKGMMQLQRCEFPDFTGGNLN